MTEIRENGLVLIFDANDNGELCLLHFGENEYDNTLISEADKQKYRAVEVQLSGEDHELPHGLKNSGTICGEALRLVREHDARNEHGRILSFVLKNEKIKVTLNYQFYDGVKAVRSYTDVENISDREIGIEYVSSFALCGIDKEGTSPLNEKIKIMIPFNTWSGELAWQSFTPEQLGYNRIRDIQLRSISVGCSGSYETNGYLPMGYVYNSDTNCGLMWQLENHGPWQWEISDIASRLYLNLSGPNENSHGFWKKLIPGEGFTSCSCCVSSCIGDFADSVGELTKYRRQIVHSSKADRDLPVIFNDYMKCMLCNASEEKLLPVIDKASDIGCEYFVLDAGWYCSLDWEKEGGEWLPDKDRFPGGIEKVMDHIRSKGMKPGIWLEAEVVGENSPMKDKYPESFFFMRHNSRVKDNKRYMLDFRNKEVTEYLDSVVDRFYSSYGVRYLKIDFNMEVGAGTEVNSDCVSGGLVEHNKEFAAWVLRLTERFPNLIIENCSSGGLRMTYGLLDRFCLQSVTDQEDYTINAIVSSKAATAILPEQAGFWIYPSAEADKYEITFNIINAILNRMHVSGAVAQLDEAQLRYMRDGIEYYKKIRRHIKSFVPFYPLGLSGFCDDKTAVGYIAGNRVFIAVWRRSSDEDEIFIPLKFNALNPHIAYPDFEENYICSEKNGLKVKMPHKNSACIIECTRDNV